MSKNHRKADQNIFHHLGVQDLIALKMLNYFLNFKDEEINSLKLDYYKSIDLVFCLRQKVNQKNQTLSKVQKKFFIL